MSRFDPPKPTPPEPDRGVQELISAFDRLTAEVLTSLNSLQASNRTTDPETPQPRIEVLPAPVEIQQTKADLEPILDKLDELTSSLINLPTSESALPGLVDLHNSMQTVNEAVEALVKAHSEKDVSPRSHFDGRLRNQNGLINDDNPLSTGGVTKVQGGNEHAEAHVTHFGSLQSEGKRAVIAGNFGGSELDTRTWIDESTGSSSVLIQNGVATLDSGGTAGDKALQRSIEPGLFRAGQTTQFQSGVILGEANANVTRRWGVFNDDNGAFFCDEGGTFKIVLRKGGSSFLEVESEDFNGDAGWEPYDRNVTYRIDYSAGKIIFMRGFTVLHVVDPSDVGTTGAWTETLNLPIRFESEQLTSGASGELKIRGASTSIIGSGLVRQEVVFAKVSVRDGVIPSGPAITIDPDLNTEPNVRDSGWLSVTDHPVGNKVVINSAEATLQVYLMNSADDSSPDFFQGADFASLVVEPGVPAVFYADYFSRFYRIVVVNTSGIEATNYTIYNLGMDEQPVPVTFSIGQSALDSFPAPLTQSVQKGKNPNGAYVNQPAGGVDNSNSTSTPLAALASFSGTFTDVNGYAGTSIFIKADVDSASSGIRIIHSTDGVTDDRVVSLFYDASALPQGIVYLIPASTEHFRIEYENGSAAQSSFICEVKHAVTPYQLPALPLGVNISDASVAQVVKSVGSLPDESGNYATLHRSEGSNAAEVALAVQEVELQLKSTNTHDHHTVNASSGSVTQLDSSPPDDRKYITIGNAGSKTIYYRINDASSWSVGIPIPPDSAIQEEVTSTDAVYVRSSSGSQAVHGISHAGTV